MLHQQLCDSEVCQGEGSHPHSGLNLGGLVLLLLARKFSVWVFATPFQLKLRGLAADGRGSLPQMGQADSDIQ